MRPRIIYVTIIFIKWRAICLPPFVILIRKQYKGNFGLLRHEIIHWQQGKRMTWPVFYIRYVLQFIFIGYSTMPMEMEARQGECKFGQWNYKHKHKFDNL